MDVRKLYDQAFLQCIERDQTLDTDDNYTNQTVLAEARKQDVRGIYKSELLKDMEFIKIYQNVINILTGPLAAKVADMIWSYQLYLRIMNQCPDELFKTLDELLRVIQSQDPEYKQVAGALDRAITAAQRHQGHADPDAYDFFKKLASL